LITLTQDEMVMMKVALIERLAFTTIELCKASLCNDMKKIAAISGDLRTINTLSAKLEAEAQVVDYLASEKERIANYGRAPANG
jgi:hypothetical protein